MFENAGRLTGVAGLTPVPRDFGRDLIGLNGASNNATEYEWRRGPSSFAPP